MLNPKKFLKTLLTQILFFQILSLTKSQQATSYTIYHTGKTYPRPLLIETSSSSNPNNNNVLALSGTNSITSLNENAFLSIYNSKGEKISSDDNGIDLNFKYEVNACIRQFTDDTYVVASGSGNLIIVLFNNNGKIKESIFTSNSTITIEVVSYKIDIFVTHDNKLIVSYCSGKEDCGSDKYCKQIRVQKYFLRHDNLFEPYGTLWRYNSDNRYISCVEMGEDYQYKIACLYVAGDCKEQVTLFSNDLNNIKQDWLMEQDSAVEKSCPFDKIIKLSNQYAVATYQIKNSMKYSVIKIFSDDDYSNEAKDNGNKIYYKFVQYREEALTGCVENTNRVDTAKWDENSFVFTCVNNGYNENQYIKVRIIYINNDGSKNGDGKYFHSINGYADYPFISKFGSRFMSIFYHYEGNGKKDNVFEIVGYPACSNVEVNDIFINSHTNTFSLENYVIKGTGEFAFSGVSDSEPIYIYFPENYETGEMKLSNGESIIAGTSIIYNSKTTSFIYYSAFDYGRVNIKFQPVRGGLYGKYCWISFEVKNCYLGCYTCQQTSNEPNYQKCSSCANSRNYYQKGDKFNDNTMNCLNIDESEGYYKDINGIFRQCNVTCKTCENSGSVDNATCHTCIDGYLKLEAKSKMDYSSNCYQYPIGDKSCPDGYFYTYELDPDDSSKRINEKCGKCYDKCSTCVKYGIEEKMNCLKCINNYYFKSNENNGNCYTGEQNSFFLKDDSTDINGKVYTPCDPACKSCYGVKITTTPISTNCIICNYDKNYFPVEEDNKNCLQPLKDTVDSSPIENHYLNKPTLSDKTTYSWKRCFRNCKYCTQNSNDYENQYCIPFNCISGTYPSFNKRTNCYEVEIKNRGYYLGKTKSQIEDPSETHPLKDIYLKCYDSCQKCSKGGDVNLNNCDECIANYYPKENIVGSCAHDPPRYYLDDENSPIMYKKCYVTCETCDSLGDSTNNKCIDCVEGISDSNKIPDGGYFNCNQNCPTGEYYPKDSPTETNCRPCVAHKEYIEAPYCINCKNYGKYHIEDQSQCIEASEVDDPDGSMIYYYKINDAYGTIKLCDTDCKTCSNSPGTKINDNGVEINTKNCLSCNDPNYLLDGNCISDCPEWYVKKDNKCINCKKVKDDHNREMYKYKTNNLEECVTRDDIPDIIKVIKSDFNYIEDLSCINPCETCLDSDNTKCLTCVSGYYAQYDTSNTEYVTCEETCGQYLVKDEDNRKCINCKNRRDNLKYFLDRSEYELEPICVDKTNPDYSEYFESTDPNKNPYGVIEKCHNHCQTCSQGSEIIDGILNMNCDTCKTQYYHDILPSKNCVSKCEDYLGKDDSNPNNKWCINCKEKRLLGMRLYKYIGNNDLYKSDYCIIEKPEGTYIDDSNYNTLKDCDISCKKCINSATSCIECSEGFTFKKKNEDICIRTCTTDYWYIDDNGKYECIDNCNDIEDEKRPYLGGRQCVEKCTDEKCDYCKINKAYILYDKLCKFRCPKGYTNDENGIKCIEKIEKDDKCNIKIYPSRHSTLISNLKLFAIEWIEEYIFQYNTSLTKNVDILPAHNMTMQIWKDDECELESSLKYDISFVNMSECRKILQEKYSLKKNEILFVKFDINRTLMMNQIHYNAYNAINKQKLNLSYCKSDIIDYALKESGINYNLIKKIYEKLGVDLFNSSEDFFNDNCYHFDDNGKDITLQERRLFYFQNVSLCEKGCDYLGINFTLGTLKCYCQNSLPTLDEANDLSEPSLNEGNFKNNIDKSNFGLFKCYNLVFNKDYFIKNKSGLCILFLIGIQIPFLLTFTYFSGFKPIYSFLNQFTYLFNPPKKNNNFYYDNNENNENNENENNSNLNNIEIYNSNKINKTSTDRSFKQINNNYSTQNEKDISLTNTNFNNTRNKNKKIIMKNTNSIHLQNFENSEKFNSTVKIFKNENEEKDNDVNQFNEDEKDELDIMNANKFDDRNFFNLFIRILKKKILFLFPFTYISVFEPFSLKFLVFIFIIGCLFFFNAIFFKKLYIQKRFYETKKNLGFDYFIKNEIIVSFLSSLITFIIQELIHILLSIKKKFVICVRTIKNKEQFLLKIKNIMSCYKKKIIIFIIIDLIGMFIFWYFCSAFYSMYIKTSNVCFYSLIFSLIFIIILQFVYSFIVCSLRFIGLSCGMNLLYKLSQILL